MKNKEKKEVFCKGRITGTTRICGRFLYHSDGRFLYINDFVLNPEDEVQILLCPCGKKNFWKRNDEFTVNSKKRRIRTKRDGFDSRYKC